MVLIYQILIEVFSALFSIEGIQMDKSKFQVISLLTGTGFTTHESELMLLTKQRRKLTQLVMLFSYIFNISIVSTIINVFISSGNTNWSELVIGVGLTILNIVLVFTLYRSNRVRRALEQRIKRLASKVKEKRKNIISVYDSYVGKVIAEVEVVELKRGMKTKSIAELELKHNYDLQILVIKRGEQIISEVKGEFIIKEGDMLLVFGKLRDIKKVFYQEVGRTKVTNV